MRLRPKNNQVDFRDDPDYDPDYNPDAQIFAGYSMHLCVVRMCQDLYQKNIAWSGNICATHMLP